MLKICTTVSHGGKDFLNNFQHLLNALFLLSLVTFFIMLRCEWRGVGGSRLWGMD